MHDDEFDVIVAGAGPSGLWLACELKLAGLKVCVLERRVHPVTQSRSLTLHGRTLEMFGLRGLAERFLAAGRPIPDWHFAGLPVRLDFSGFAGRHPYMLFLPQTHTERLLAERAAELGVDIRLGHSVSDLRQADDACVLDVDGPGGRTPMHARFVVGADGARSTVRTLAGVAFPGSEQTQSVMMADAIVDMPPGPPVLSVEDASGGLTVLPLGDGRHRIIRLDFARSHLDRHAPLSEDELRASIVRMLGHDLKLREASWLTRFGDETRLAAHYRSGRILLAGDAAHIHAPMGGQGLNVGLQDAMNLGWKLAAVIRDGAPDALLDTYESERRPVGARLAENTLAQVALVSRLDEAGVALRRTITRMLRHRSVNRELAGEVSGFDLAYPQPLPGFEALSTAACSGLGERLPDTELAPPGTTAPSLLASMADGSWLMLGSAEDAGFDLPSWLHPRRVKRLAGASIDAYLRRQASVCLLVRPDGHIAAGLPSLADSQSGLAAMSS